MTCNATIRFCFFPVILICLISFGLILTEGRANAALTDEYHLVLDVPVFVTPENISPDAWFPAMRQSLHLSKDFYQISHTGIMAYFDEKPRWQTVFSVAAFDILTTWLPLGTSWLHEEWHRAVMGRRGISSYNDIYKFEIFEELIAVSKVKDEDLSRLKRDHPREMVRLHTAGIEAQYEMNFLLEKDRFFYNSDAFEDFVLWLNYLNSILYIDTCTDKEADELTDEMMEEEGRSISKRDFTGLDFTAYVYDLFRPEEAYEERGTHPSGTGIKRYIKYSDLTGAEKDFLKCQRNLSLLNLVNPFLFNKRGFNGSNPFSGNRFKWNATLRHHLTPFGYMIAANVFLKDDHRNALVSLVAYRNKYRTWPGLSFELLRRPEFFFSQKVNLSLFAGIWLQPEEQAFRTEKAEPGGIVAFRVSKPVTKHMELYIELEGKTKGWVAGNTYLDENFSTIWGVVLI